MGEGFVGLVSLFVIRISSVVEIIFFLKVEKCEYKWREGGIVVEGKGRNKWVT